MIVFPLNVYQTGVAASAEINVPNSARKYELRLSRCHDGAPDVWPESSQLLRVQVELFINGEWLPWGSFDAYGGKYFQRGGNVAEYSWLKAGLNDLAPNRKLRVFLLTAAPVKTAIEIEVS